MSNFTAYTNLRVIIVLSLLSLASCTDSKNEAEFDRIEKLPLPLSVNTSKEINLTEPIRPLPPIMASALVTPVVSLGRDLFHDNRLSGDGTLSCSSCHGINKGGVDNLQTSTGIRGQKGPINSPTVLNSGFNFRQFWDGRAPSLDEQARGPVEAEIEMGAKWNVVVQTLSEDDSLKTRFKEIFGTGEITEDRIVHAIARYEETLVTPSPFDRYLNGDKNAISVGAIAGYKAFKNYGCASCHQGINIGGNLYQQFGVLQNIDIDEFSTDRAIPIIKERGEVVSLLKVPSLRNVELTAPYFHSGKIKDLSTAVKIMGLSQTGIQIPESDVLHIVEFLQSLTGDWQMHARLVQ